MNTRTRALLTDSGTDFLRDLCAKYCAGQLTADGLVAAISEAAAWYSGWTDEVSDRMFTELYKMI